MAGYRIDRINDDIRRELASILSSLKDPRVRGVISITRVDTTADLRYCKVYVSALERERMGEVMKGLKSASGFIRRELGQRMSLRLTPELQFIADDSIDRGARLLQMMDELGKSDS